MDAAGEQAATAVVIVADRGAGVGADVEGLLGGEDQWPGLVPAPPPLTAAIRISPSLSPDPGSDLTSFG